MEGYSPLTPMSIKLIGVFYLFDIHISMLKFCPHCGNELQIELIDGLADCARCKRVFDSSDCNQLLSAAWQMRRQKLSLEQLQTELKLDNDFSILVYAFVEEHCYGHEEFLGLLKKLGVANKSYVKYS